MSAGIHQLAEGVTIDDLLCALSRGRQLFALEHGEGGQYHLQRADGWEAEKHTLGAFRSIEPLKSVFFQPREYFGSITAGGDEPPSGQREGRPPEEGQPDGEKTDGGERIVVGVKNCDLSGLTIQDHVFLGLSPSEPQYAECREKTILVTCDCTDCLEVCFCPVVGEQPHAESGYDINIAPLARQFLIDAGSKRGEQLLESMSEYLSPAEDELIAERDQCRAAMYERVLKQSAECGLHPEMDFAAAVRNAEESQLWADFATDCVECGACNFTCCTCHCFLLVDGASPESDAVRGKQWDSCLLMNFARVAGGGNPRRGRAARLRNRFQKKFSYFPEVIGQYACDGCGRCTEVCTGNIDIRAVLKRAVDELESLHADAGDD